MSQPDRGRVAAALVLILIGLWWLAVQFFPGWHFWSITETTWPLVVVGIGAIFALIGLLTWTPGFMVPAAIIGGIGGLLYWQNLTNNWESWSYAWAFIPGFVGVGVVLCELMRGHLRKAIEGGGSLVLISLILIALFSSFFGSEILPLRSFWPVLLILLGVVVLVRGLFERRNLVER